MVETHQPTKTKEEEQEEEDFYVKAFSEGRLEVFDTLLPSIVNHVSVGFSARTSCDVPLSYTLDAPNTVHNTTPTLDTGVMLPLPPH